MPRHVQLYQRELVRIHKESNHGDYSRSSGANHIALSATHHCICWRMHRGSEWVSFRYEKSVMCYKKKKVPFRIWDHERFQSPPRVAKIGQNLDDFAAICPRCHESQHNGKKHRPLQRRRRRDYYCWFSVSFETKKRDFHCLPAELHLVRSW